MIIVLPYIISPVYDFLPSKPFSGQSYYNPYGGQDSLWQISNFHAHSRSWGGLTDGKDSHVDTVIATYRQMGYTHIGISNYQKITQLNIDGLASIPTYEHGYNIKKRHHLCLGAKRVVWLDFIFAQTMSHKQFMLNRLRGTTDFLAINHPKFCDGFEEADFALLSNYDAVEVLNHYRTSIPHWDSALSSGYYAVLLANDDMHDVKGMGEIGVNLTMVNTSSIARSDIIDALKAGRHYGVKVKRKPDENLQIKRERNASLIRPKSIAMTGDTLCAIFNRKAAEIRFAGQDGKLRKTLSLTDFAKYVFAPDDTYIRIEIDDNEGNLYLFNPVIRTDAAQPANPNRFVVNVFDTSIKWILITLLIILCGFFFLRRRMK
jgi:hypothetical protein